MVADPRLDPTPRNGNQALFDAALRHQVGLQRFTAGEVRRVQDLLEQADRDLVRKLRERLGSVRQQPVNFTTDRLKRLLADIRIARREAMSTVRGQLSPTLRRFSVMEHDFESRMIQGSMPMSIELATVTPATLRAIVTTKPFNGNLLGDWYGSLARSDQSNLLRAVRLGLSQGETLDEMMRRVAGTRAAGFSDGVLSITRRNAETVVRTAINGVSNAARETLWNQNADIISALRWTATLDGRTSAICRARDGKLAPVQSGGTIPDGGDPLSPPGARPPAHPGCRSVMVAVVDGVAAVGRRPTVRDTRRREAREIDFRREARRQGRPIQEIRNDWADANVGSVPAAVSYDEWMRTQPAVFQQSVLGKTDAILFRKGGLSLDKFVDKSGRKFTLDELSRTQPEAFEAAGLNPDDF